MSFKINSWKGFFVSLDLILCLNWKAMLGHGVTRHVLYQSQNRSSTVAYCGATSGRIDNHTHTAFAHLLLLSLDFIIMTVVGETPISTRIWFINWNELKIQVEICYFLGRYLCYFMPYFSFFKQTKWEFRFSAQKVQILVGSYVTITIATISGPFWNKKRYTFV